MTKKPNLFDFATSELSQDAFLCWLLSWAKNDYADKDNALHKTGVEFVRSMMNKFGEPASEGSLSIEVKKQYKGIDILAEIEVNRKKYVLVIEDKTETSMHSDQLRRYKKTAEEDYPGHTLLLVYLKTGAISHGAKAEEAGYKVYSGKDLLDVLDSRASQISNDIFVDFHKYLKDKVSGYESFREKKVDEWVKKWRAWEGFFSALQSKEVLGKKLEWGYAANPSGGELVAYWGDWCVRNYKDNVKVYLEIHYKTDERSFLAFKVYGVPKEDDRSRIRWELYDKLMKSAEKHGWGGKVDKPTRFGSGNTMIFCQTVNNDCWLAKKNDGKLDMEKTIANLKDAECILRDAVGQPT